MEKLCNYEIRNSYRSSVNGRAINSVRTDGEFGARARKGTGTGFEPKSSSVGAIR
jgi:hypothetical protein